MWSISSYCTLHVTHLHELFLSLRSELYDPYSAVLSDSELKMSDSSHCPSDQENKLGDSLSPAGQLFSPETRPCENQGFSSGQRLHDRQTYSPNTESLDRPGYCSIGRHLDHRVCSSDQIIPGSSTQRSYGGQRTNEEERITVPEFRREVSLVKLRIWQLLFLDNLGSLATFSLELYMKMYRAFIVVFYNMWRKETFFYMQWQYWDT